MMKNNLKLFIGIVIGIIISGSIGAYAASKIYAGSVDVDTTNMSELGASSNVNAALTYLYGRAGSIGAPSEANMASETVYYYGSSLGEIANISTNYMDLVNAGKTYFIMQSGYAQAACLYYNNQIHCFRPDRAVIEYRHAQEVFGSSTCSASGNTFTCSGTGFYIQYSVSDYGDMIVGTSGNWKWCRLYDSGYFMCS